MTVLFGFSSADITPGEPVRLGGYVARTKISRGVADGISAQILSFREESRRLVLISLDLLALDRDEAATLSKRLANLTNLHPEDFEICCTHAHSAPNVISSPMIDAAPVERDFLDSLPRRLAPAVEEAVGSESPLRAGWATGTARGVGAARVAWSLPETNESDRLPVEVLRFNEINVVGFGCHPTILGHENLLVSGDLFGAARRTLEERLGQPCALLQGAAADISARATRREQTLREAKRLGGLLADAAVEIRGSIREVRPVSGLRVSRASPELPLKSPQTPEEARLRVRDLERRLSRLQSGADHVEERLARTALEGARAERSLSEMFAVGASVERRCEVFAARVGGLCFLGVGAELSSALGREISTRSPLRPTVVLGCCGGYAGYVMGREAANSYESLASPFAPEAGEAIVEESLGLLEEVAAD